MTLSNDLNVSFQIGLQESNINSRNENKSMKFLYLNKTSSFTDIMFMNQLWKYLYYLINMDELFIVTICGRDSKYINFVGIHTNEILQKLYIFLTLQKLCQSKQH